jgi:hypothetical protein
MKGQLEKELAWLGWAEARFSYPFIVPAADAQRIAAEIRPDSPVWRLQPSVLGGVLAGNDQGSLESPYAAKAPAAFSGNAANSLLSALYTSLLHTGRYEQLKPAMARLHAASPDSGMTKSALRKVGGMELLTVPGRKVPAFELPMKTAKKYLQSGTQ